MSDEQDPVAKFGEKGCGYIVAGFLLAAVGLIALRLLFALAHTLW